VRRKAKRWVANRMGVTRLEHAVSYLLAREVNLLSAAEPGAAGNSTLRDAYFHLFAVLRPSVFCDVGANDGAMSLAVRAAAPRCEVYAYEANPEIHARYTAALTERGVIYRNVAVSNRDGRATVYAPRTLSRAWVDGSMVPASIKEKEDTGKTSLLMRDEEATYDSFDVEKCTLDRLFQDRIEDDGASFFLWVDVEGAAEQVLEGASGVLRRTLALLVECENFPFWRDGSSVSGVASRLFQAGFVPVARDREYGDGQFNVLFVAGRVAHLLGPALFDGRSPVRACLLSSGAPAPESPAPRPFLSSVVSYLQAEVPVFVPCFNNVTYTAQMAAQLRTLGFRHIVLVDGGSTYPAMRDFLADPGFGVTVVSLPNNPGPPRHVFLDPGTFALLPRHFCITDPDLAFNPAMPSDFLGDLAALAARERARPVSRSTYLTATRCAPRCFGSLGRSGRFGIGRSGTGAKSSIHCVPGATRCIAPRLTLLSRYTIRVFSTQTTSSRRCALLGDLPVGTCLGIATICCPRKKNNSTVARRSARTIWVWESAKIISRTGSVEWRQR
jgi:FkbM family methyltransferase